MGARNTTGGLIMTLRKIEIIEDEIKEGINVRVKGDICSIDHALATAYIDAGLAKDVETGETGERVAGAVKLEVDDVVIKMSAK